MHGYNPWCKYRNNLILAALPPPSIAIKRMWKGGAYRLLSYQLRYRIQMTLPYQIQSSFLAPNCLSEQSQNIQKSHSLSQTTPQRPPESHTHKHPCRPSPHPLVRCVASVSPAGMSQMDACVRVGHWRTLWGCMAEAVTFLVVLGLFGQIVRGTSTTTTTLARVMYR